MKTNGVPGFEIKMHYAPHDNASKLMSVLSNHLYIVVVKGESVTHVTLFKPFLRILAGPVALVPNGEMRAGRGAAVARPDKATPLEILRPVLPHGGRCEGRDKSCRIRFRYMHRIFPLQPGRRPMAGKKCRPVATAAASAVPGAMRAQMNFGFRSSGWPNHAYETQRAILDQ